MQKVLKKEVSIEAVRHHVVESFVEVFGCEPQVIDQNTLKAILVDYRTPPSSETGEASSDAADLKKKFTAL